MTQKKKTNAQDSSLTGIHRAVPIILFAVAVFTMFCYITQDIGALGHAISTVFLGLFSYGAYAIPLLLAIHAIFYPADIAEKKLTSRVIFSLIAITFISAVAHSITYWRSELVFNAVEFFKNGQASVGGGFIGGIVGFCLMKIVGRVGLVVIAAAILAIYVSYFFGNGQGTISKLFFNIFKAIIIVLATIEKAIKGVFRKAKNAKSEKIKRDAELKSIEVTDDDFFAVANGMQRLSVAELGIRETREESMEFNPTLHEKIFFKSAVSEEEAEEMAMREKAEEIFYAAANDVTAADEPAEAPARRRIVNISYGEADTAVDRSRSEAPSFEAACNEPVKKADEGADAVFTQSFDPFNIMMSEKLADKPSSRSLADEKTAARKVVEDISELTPEEIERQKRILEFEKRKASVIEGRRAIPVDNDGEFTGTPKKVDFSERSSESLGKTTEDAASSSFTFDKAERTVEPPKATPANYTSIGFGTDSEPATPIFSKPTFTTPETIYSYEPPKEEPVYTPRPNYTPTYEPVVNKTAPTTVPFVEDEPVQIFERKAPTESYTMYSASRESAPTVTERVESEPVKESQTFTMNTAPAEEEVFSYTATKDIEEEKQEEYIPEFKPYQVVMPEDVSEKHDEPTEAEEPETVSTLKIEREYIVDNEDNEPEYDEYTDEDEASEYDEYTDEDGEDDGEYDEEIDKDEIPEDDGDSFESQEIPPEERNPVVQGYKDMFHALRDDKPEEDEVDHSRDYQLTSPDEIEEEAYDEDEDGEEYDAPPFEHSTVRPTPKPKAEKKEEKPEKKKPDFSHYQLPPIDLLGLDPETNDDTSEINENTKILIDTLASFNVTASIKGVDRGPRITRYEVVPARGVKVNAITSLYNDICLNLAKEGVRMEAPIPGKSAIGFEIPNKHPKNVRLRELLECDEFINAKSKTFVAIGKDVAGNPVFGDISKYPHALICGATGMGKSVCINSIMVSMLYRVRPDEVKLIMVDPKKVEFKMYSGIPHLLIPVITESKQAAGALMWAVEEMERRYELIEKFNVRNLDAYNEKVSENPSLGDKLPKIVIVIDELADLMMQVRDPVEDLIMRIAQKARAAGIHLIIGTQRPSVQVITGSIKANIPTRMSCKVTSQVDSRTVFDNSGAEKLLNRGDMLYSTVDKPKPCRVQGAFVSDKEVEDIMEFLKSQVAENSYDDEVFAEINKAAQKCGNNKKSGGVSADDIADDGEECGYYSDQQFLDAVELAIRSKKVSTSLLQRKLSIGYGKAAKYIDAMEEIGIVSEPKGQKPRDVLLTMDEWHEKLSRVDLD